jgi:adenylate cyclase
MNETNHIGAAQVVRWMLSEGRRNAHMREFGEQMCARIVAAGIPIWRAFCVVGTLHPLVAASAYIWNRERPGTARVLAEHGLLSSPEFMQSPIAAARREGRTFRRRLLDPACPIDFEVLAKFKSEGGTDYIALPMIRSDGGANVVTFLTDYRDGFSDAEITGLEEIAQVLGLIVELQSSRRTAKSLLETYVGPRTGERVLSGAIRRGAGETIRAVIWFCDLRGFTALADRLARDELTALLNEYFEIMVGVVKAEGGEVLKFTGDGMLAIFELCTGEDVSRCCRAALRAADAAEDGSASLTASAKRRERRKSSSDWRSIRVKFITAILGRRIGSTSR